MIVFGGLGTDGTVKYLSLKTYTWYSVATVSFWFLGHTANLIGTQLYLFAGYDSKTGSCSNGLTRFDTKAFNMKSLQTSG